MYGSFVDTLELQYLELPKGTRQYTHKVFRSTQLFRGASYDVQNFETSGKNLLL